MARTRTWVYCAGPYRSDPVLGTRAACEAGNWLWELGYAPIVPHLSHLWHIITPRPEDHWLAYDLELLARCDYLLRLPGSSSGADGEVARAHEIGIPVFEGREAFYSWHVECREILEAPGS